MTPTPQIFLSFSGNCEAAFRFYVERLGAILRGTFPYKGSPMLYPDGWEDKIMHGSITVAGLTVMGADEPPERYAPPKGFRIFLEVEDPAETERLFNALADNATIEMPVQSTFWSLRFGTLTDQFGIPWALSCSQVPEPGAFQ
jgi:PhnB protein